MEITENKKYIVELRELLILEDKKSDKRRIEKINELRSIIFENIKSKMGEIKSNTIVNIDSNNKVTVSKPKENKKIIYEELKSIYRGAIEIAQQCRDIKKIMRDEK